MRVRKIISKIRNAYVSAVKGYRDGGVASVKIAYLKGETVLSGKTVLITGGGSGIGYSIAKKCAECGAKVLITGRNEEKLQKAAQTIGTSTCSYLVWDISHLEELESKLSDAEKILGGSISCLVNNAGVAPSLFWGNVNEDEWNKIYNTNSKGLFFLSQSITKRWVEEIFDDYKKIINISSQGGFVGATYPYRMVKWDIRGLTEGLGKALIKNRIIVNGIAPGIVKTSMQSFALNQGDNLYTYQNPIERVILPEEIAELALFLISDASNAIVGQTIICDGGYTLK